MVVLEAVALAVVVMVMVTVVVVVVLVVMVLEVMVVAKSLADVLFVCRARPVLLLLCALCLHARGWSGGCSLGLAAPPSCRKHTPAATNVPMLFLAVIFVSFS